METMEGRTREERKEKRQIEDGLGEGRAQMPPLPPPLPLMFYSTHPDWFKSFAKK